LLTFLRYKTVHMNNKRKFYFGIILTGLSLLLPSLVLMACQPNTPVQSDLPTLYASATVTVTSAPIPSLTATLIPTARPTTAGPVPTPDMSRLDEPPLPANATQFERGRHLFWLNCAACHGDRGQGLTDEYRSLYVEDANCWARGCHAGRNEDKGFPIPHVVPAVISSTGSLPPFATPEQLFEFLRSTHPPQNPGFMSDQDYWDLTAYLLTENGRLPAGQVLDPQK
jgi:mono/diheme cytochrome c family protein